MVLYTCFFLYRVLIPQVIREINGQSPRDLLLPLLNGPQVPGTGSSMAGPRADRVLGSASGVNLTPARVSLDMARGKWGARMFFLGGMASFLSFFIFEGEGVV